MPTVHLIVKGKVQGVFYRANAKKAADKNGVKGWVQNTPDGNVEITASAEQEPLESFIQWCHKGTTAAKVSEVVVTEVGDQPFADFVINR